MERRFQDRREAGRQLASSLTKYLGHAGALVLALPRGGVPVGAEVARALHLPLDVFVVRKLGVPGREELAFGAIAEGGVRVLNDDVVRMLGLSPRTIDVVAARERQELERREAAYRGGRPEPAVAGRIVIVVDDGIATGATMRAAVSALRQLGATRIVVAAPVAALATVEELRMQADECIVLVAADDFGAVGQWYRDFSQTTDDEVRTLLEAVEPALPRHGSGGFSGRGGADPGT